MSIESIVQSLDAAEARKQAVERRRSAVLRELAAAMDERDRRKSGLSPEEWADLKRERASAREALRAARQHAKKQRGGRTSGMFGAGHRRESPQHSWTPQPRPNTSRLPPVYTGTPHLHPNCTQ